jgi:hypothetical protein
VATGGDHSDTPACVLPLLSPQKVDLRRSLRSLAVVTTATPAGACLSFAFVAGLIALVVSMCLTFVQQLQRVTSDTRWTAASDVYPLRVKCRSAGGCFVSNFYSGIGARSNECLARVPASQGCISLAPGEVTTVSVCASSYVRDSVLISWGFNESADRGQPSSVPGWLFPREFGAATVSDMVSLPTGVAMDMEDPLHMGVSSLVYVNTLNKTLSGSGAERHEWFATLLTEASPVAANLSTMTGCAREMMGRGRSPFVHASLRIGPAWYQISVERRSVTELIGNIGGVAGLLFQAGGIAAGAWLAFQQRRAADTCRLLGQVIWSKG